MKTLARTPRFLSLLTLGFGLGFGWVQAQVAAPDIAQARKPTTSALWVGNSYFYSNNSMHSHVEALMQASGRAQPYQAISATISGAGIGWHDLHAYLRPGTLGTFRFDESNGVVFTPQGRRFDSVLLMDCSQCATHPALREGFHADMARQVEVVRAYGAQPVLFMSWAYQDRPEMTEVLVREYVAAGRTLDAQVIPAGLAFARALAERPDIRLHQPDLRHPTMRGTYLAACTVFAALTGLSPVGSRYTAGIDPEIARFLQTAAWNTVLEFQHKP
ncbi:MAG: hypothetical protein RL260_1012 [Pseudomonadota bacterium]|jgi:hypothetical protein